MVAGLPAYRSLRDLDGHVDLAVVVVPFDRVPDAIPVGRAAALTHLAELSRYSLPEAEFMAHLDEMSEQAFDDQCTGGNARYPLVKEIRELYIRAYNGDPIRKGK